MTGIKTAIIYGFLLLLMGLVVLSFPTFYIRLRNSGDVKTNISSSSSPSSASSECSEELSFDFISSSSCGDFLPVYDVDYLNTSLNLLDDSSLTGIIPPIFLFLRLSLNEHSV